MTSLRLPIRTNRGVLLLLVCIAAGNVVQICRLVGWGQVREAAMRLLGDDADNRVSIEDQRYQPIRTALNEIGVQETVGYITDLHSGNDFFEDWYLAQYALAPVVVVSGADDFPYVIGRFKNPETDITRFPKLSPIVVAGDGLVLFRRTTK